jgi:hypothetical protein
MSAIKNIEERVKEAIQINKQVRTLGGLIESQNEVKLRDINNKWIRTGEPCGCKLSIGDVILYITYSNTKQSGIVLERD